MDKFCISCNQEGHTYLQCDYIPFFGILACAFGLDVSPYTDLSIDEIANSIKSRIIAEDKFPIQLDKNLEYDINHKKRELYYNGYLDALNNKE